MIKVLFQITIFLALFQSCKRQNDKAFSHKTNYIDSIQNTKQIIDLISKIDNRYKEFKINEKLMFANENCQKLSNSLKIQPWTKADFDNNGLTDILVVGKQYDHSVICVLDKDGKYEIKTITRRIFQSCTFPIIENNKIKYFFENEIEPGKWDKPRKLKQIILTYKFGDFIEENQKPVNHKIEKIEYSTTMCYGTCPVFNIKINSDKKAKWKAEMYNEIDNKIFKGNFQTKITTEKFNELVNLLNYIDFESLKDNYSVNWTDDQSCTLKITYDNGKSKSISDYGLVGTYGLDRVYQMLFELRENQNWTK